MLLIFKTKKAIKTTDFNLILILEKFYLCLWFFFGIWSLSLRPASINWLSVLGKGGGGILGSATNGCFGMWFVQEPLLPQSTLAQSKKK